MPLVIRKILIVALTLALSGCGFLYEAFIEIPPPTYKVALEYTPGEYRQAAKEARQHCREKGAEKAVPVPKESRRYRGSPYMTAMFECVPTPKPDDPFASDS